MLRCHLEHGALRNRFVPRTRLSGVQKKRPVFKIALEGMGMPEEHHLGIRIHVKGQMHQLELGLRQLEIVRFLDKIVLVMYFMQVRVIVAVNRDITFAGRFKLLKHFGFSDIAGMDQKLSAIVKQVVKRPLRTSGLGMGVGEYAYFQNDTLLSF